MKDNMIRCITYFHLFYLSHARLTKIFVQSGHARVYKQRQGLRTGQPKFRCPCIPVLHYIKKLLSGSSDFCGNISNFKASIPYCSTCLLHAIVCFCLHATHRTAHLLPGNIAFRCSKFLFHNKF